MVNQKVQHRLGRTENVVFITIAAVAIVMLLYWVGLLRIAELKSLDLMFQMRGQVDPDPEIIVVAIDDQTLTELGMEWPLPRSLHAQVIIQLQSAGAKFIGLVFPLQETISSPSEDTILVRSLEKAGIVWLPEEFSGVKDSFYSLQSLLEPDTALSKAAAGVAFVNLSRDEDGFIRRISLSRLYQEQWHYHMASAACGYLQGEPPESGSRSLLINYAGPPRTYQTVSYYQVLEGLLPDNFFANKVVLIGLNSVNTAEVFPTAFSGQEPMSRTEIIANGLGNLLSQNDIGSTNVFLNFILMILVAGAVSTTTVTQPLLRGSLLVLFVGVVYFVVAFVLFAQQQIWLPVVLPLVALALTYGALTLYRYSLEQRQKNELRKLFSRYVSEDVVKDILQQSDAQMLGGKRQELTILFSDIRGFTSLSQKLAPEQVVKLLNQYLTAMTGIIFRNKGTIDKFLGDGIMVIFGAPLPLADAPQRALQTAIQMQEKLQELDIGWERDGPGRLQMGIGIHTGTAVIGNIGSPQRMNYTAIGDTVNIASRLQELTKTYNHSIILSEATYQHLSETIGIKPLGSEVLRGRNEPLVIYGVALPENR